MKIDLIYSGNPKLGPVPFGVISLGSFLEQSGHSVRVLDFDGQIINPSSFSKKLGLSNMKVTSFSLCGLPQAQRGNSKVPNASLCPQFQDTLAVSNQCPQVQEFGLLG